jgi:hypothetical protein
MSREMEILKVSDEPNLNYFDIKGFIGPSLPDSYIKTVYHPGTGLPAFYKDLDANQPPENKPE